MDADLSLRRIERTAVLLCVAMAAAAWLLTRGVNAPAAVLGGGLLVGVSYRTLKGAVTRLADLAMPGSDRAPGAAARAGWTLAKVMLRYALLALLAYVMIARLRLHPIGLLVGVTSVVAAAFFEAVRLLAKNR